jgi:hypothetical protein
MPRGRQPEVRYFFDDKAGRVIAVGSDGMRVLEEISGRRRRGPNRRGPGRPRKAATEGAAPTTGKRRGRPRKAKSEEKKES